MAAEDAEDKKKTVIRQQEQFDRSSLHSLSGP